MKKFWEFLPHLSICLSIGLLVFSVLDGYNPYMQWLNSQSSKAYLTICCLTSILTALLLIARQRRRPKRRAKRQPDEER